VAPRVEYSERPITFFLDGRRVGDYQVQTSRAHLDVGVQNKWGEVRLGAFAGHLTAREDFGLLVAAPDFDIQQAGYTASATFDQLDRPQFPRSGMLASVNVFGTTSTGDPAGNYAKVETRVVGARSHGNHTLAVAGYYGDTFDGDTKIYDPFLLGGFLRGSGYRMDELIGPSAGLLRAVYTYRIASLPRAFGSGVYLGGSLEETRAAIGSTFNEVGTRPSASVFVSVDSFLGPIYLAYGKALSGAQPNSIYLLLGAP
jgi:NTE family protein